MQVLRKMNLLIRAKIGPIDMPASTEEVRKFQAGLEPIFDLKGAVDDKIVAQPDMPDEE